MRRKTRFPLRHVLRILNKMPSLFSLVVGQHCYQDFPVKLGAPHMSALAQPQARYPIHNLIEDIFL
jgi:hypothetical protein